MLFKGVIGAIWALTREVRMMTEALDKSRVPGLLGVEELEKQKYALVKAAGEIVEKKFVEMSIEERLVWVEARVERGKGGDGEGEVEGEEVVEVRDHRNPVHLPVPTNGEAKVFYANEETAEQLQHKLDMEEYWRSRGWGGER